MALDLNMDAEVSEVEQNKVELVAWDPVSMPAGSWGLAQLTPHPFRVMGYEKTDLVNPVGQPIFMATVRIYANRFPATAEDYAAYEQHEIEVPKTMPTGAIVQVWRLRAPRIEAIVMGAKKDAEDDLVRSESVHPATTPRQTPIAPPGVDAEALKELIPDEPEMRPMGSARPPTATGVVPQAPPTLPAAADPPSGGLTETEPPLAPEPPPALPPQAPPAPGPGEKLTCPDHPTYNGKRRPQAKKNCPVCDQIYALTQAAKPTEPAEAAAKPVEPVPAPIKEMSAPAPAPVLEGQLPLAISGAPGYIVPIMGLNGEVVEINVLELARALGAVLQAQHDRISKLEESS